MPSKLPEWAKNEGFTEQFRRVLQLAQDEALQFNHHYIGAEHLLLAIIQEEGVAARVLASMGIQLPKVRSAVVFVIGRSTQVSNENIGLTSQAKKVIELAIDEARRLNHHYIGTEHLLLGIVREDENIAAGVLESMGVDLQKVRVHVKRVVDPTPSDRQGGPTPPQASLEVEGFSKFTVPARDSIWSAREEALRLNHDYIGTEHLLLGLLCQRTCAAALLLDEFGVQLQKVRSAIEFVIGRGEESPEGEIGLTPRAQIVIHLAAGEVYLTNRNYIGTEHLLFGLVREGEGIAAGVLDSLGVDLEKVRARIEQFHDLEGGPTLGDEHGGNK